MQIVHCCTTLHFCENWKQPLIVPDVPLCLCPRVEICSFIELSIRRLIWTILINILTLSLGIVTHYYEKIILLFVVALNKVSDLLSSPNHLILLRHRPNLKHKNLKVLHVFAQTDQAQSFLVGFRGHWTLPTKRGSLKKAVCLLRASLIAIIARHCPGDNCNIVPEIGQQWYFWCNSI